MPPAGPAATRSTGAARLLWRQRQSSWHSSTVGKTKRPARGCRSAWLAAAIWRLARRRWSPSRSAATIRPEGRPVQPAWAGRRRRLGSGPRRCMRGCLPRAAWLPGVAERRSRHVPGLAHPGPRATPRPGCGPDGYAGRALIRTPRPADRLTRPPSALRLDCSTMAEGRIIWAATMPDGMAAYDGPVAIDDELSPSSAARPTTACSCSSPSTMPAMDVSCGSGPGTSQADDGLDHGRGSRTPLPS